LSPDAPAAAFSLRARPPALQWGLLAAATLAFIVPLELVHLPAALLLGAMAAGILVASFEGTPVVPQRAFIVAQGLIGCLVARSIGPGILLMMVQHWPVFLTGVVAVLVFSTTLGGLLARWKVLPGTTAVWGSAPGAATVMVLMSEAYGGDARLVAFMQFLRVMLVALVASVVARLWVTPGGATPHATIWFPALDTLSLLESLALGVGGAFIGAKSRIPAGALLLPLAAGIALSIGHVVAITLPPWLMAGCYALIGWTIGLRFTRAIVLYAARALPRVLAAILTLIALCGALAWALHLALGTDMLTAYLATSPGGADSIAIIAASTHVDMSFVMAMQTARFLLVLLIGPGLSRMVARWTQA
jgi:membrane AbrB-like protein